MTSFLLRTDRSQQMPSLQGSHVLDLFPRDRAATVHAAGSLLDTLDPSQAARDLLVLAAGVYAADKITPRESTDDGFTRDFELSVPVAEQARFNEAHEGLEHALSFLTGDAWTLRFRRIVGAPRQQRISAPETKSVALFSGGLDSLAGAIDLLSSEPLVLVGHHESGPTAHRQSELAEKLREHYGDSHVQLRQLLLGPAKANSRQAAPLPGAREETTRGRSFLFIAAGLALADTIGPHTPLYLPENGFIGINVPLVPARSGALSTRTTHPYFLAMMTAALDTLGLAGHELQESVPAADEGRDPAGIGQRDTTRPASAKERLLRASDGGTMGRRDVRKLRDVLALHDPSRLDASRGLGLRSAVRHRRAARHRSARWADRPGRVAPSGHSQPHRAARRLRGPSQRPDSGR